MQLAHTESGISHWQLPDIMAGNLRVVLARTHAEVELAQQLRYEIFVGEIGAKASPDIIRYQRDYDEFDDVCDHLLVVDTTLDPSENPVVGTYRLIRGTVAKKLKRFYSQSEFDISTIGKYNDEVLELGRSCIRKKYRNSATLQLLWRGIGAYVAHYGVKLMFGCASFPGVSVDPIKKQLSYLYHYHLAPESCRTRALQDLYIPMNYMSKEACSDKKIRSSLPPLIKGYLTIGAYIGDGAVYDHVCNTIDVSIIVKTDTLDSRYFRRFVHS